MQENPKTSIGAATGAVLGAGLGYGLGKGKGAAIGAVVGGLAGGAIGQYMDKQKREFDQMLAESQGREQSAIMQGVQKEKDALILTFKSDVLFDTNSSTIKPAAYSSGEIDRVAQILNRYPDTTIKVIGYTDSTGSEVHNQQLSELRANAVKNALVVKGVNGMRITTVGMGESNPVADNSTAAGRQLNRRVNIVIEPIQQQGQQPQGQPQGQYQPPAVYAPPPVAYAPAPVVYYPPPVVYGGYGPPYYSMGRVNIIYNNGSGYHGHRW
jgi:outer membrane protein OmpA-like peptidoglycan-associated protein